MKKTGVSRLEKHFFNNFSHGVSGFVSTLCKNYFDNTCHLACYMIRSQPPGEKRVAWSIMIHEKIIRLAEKISRGTGNTDIVFWP